VKEKGKITNKEYQELNAVSNKTAFLELSDLKEKNFLITKGSGRSLIYTIKVTKR
jgi:ATP-dependent DNA helicase RecG